MTMSGFALAVAAAVVLVAAPFSAGYAGEQKGGHSASRDARGGRQDGGTSLGGSHKGERSARSAVDSSAARRGEGRSLGSLRDTVAGIQQRQIRQERREVRSIEDGRIGRFDRLQAPERRLEQRERALVDDIARLAEKSGRVELTRRVERYERLQPVEDNSNGARGVLVKRSGRCSEGTIPLPCGSGAWRTSSA